MELVLNVDHSRPSDKSLFDDSLSRPLLRLPLRKQRKVIADRSMQKTESKEPLSAQELFRMLFLFAITAFAQWED
jgi:hypothetical protein